MRHCASFASKIDFYSEGSPTSHIDSTHTSCWFFTLRLFLRQTFCRSHLVEECCLLSRNGTHLAIWAVAYNFFFVRITQFTPLCNSFTGITSSKHNSTYLTDEPHTLGHCIEISVSRAHAVCRDTHNQFFTELIICSVHIPMCTQRRPSHSQILQSHCGIFHTRYTHYSHDYAAVRGAVTFYLIFLSVNSLFTTTAQQKFFLTGNFSLVHSAWMCAGEYVWVNSMRFNLFLLHALSLGSRAESQRTRNSKLRHA